MFTCTHFVQSESIHSDQQLRTYRFDERDRIDACVLLCFYIWNNSLWGTHKPTYLVYSALHRWMWRMFQPVILCFFLTILFKQQLKQQILIWPVHQCFLKLFSHLVKQVAEFAPINPLFLSLYVYLKENLPPPLTIFLLAHANKVSFFSCP